MEKKKRDFVTPVCIFISIVAIMVTGITCDLKKPVVDVVVRDSPAADFEWQYAEAGEFFEIDGKAIVVEKAETIDTSGLYDRMSADEKMVAVTVKMMPEDEWDGYEASGEDYSAESGGNADVNWADFDLIYAGDGVSYRIPLDYYDMRGKLSESRFSVEEFTGEELLTGYEYHYCYEGGETGKFYFLTGKEAEEIRISFQERDRNFVLRRRVSVSLPIEESGA